MIWQTSEERSILTPFYVLPNIPVAEYINSESDFSVIGQRIYLHKEEGTKVIEFNEDYVITKYCEEYNNTSMMLLTLIAQSYRNLIAINENNIDSRDYAFRSNDVKIFPNQFKVYHSKTLKFDVNANQRLIDYYNYLIFNNLASSYLIKNRNFNFSSGNLWLVYPNSLALSNFAFSETAEDTQTINNGSLTHSLYWAYFNSSFTLGLTI